MSVQGRSNSLYDNGLPGETISISTTTVCPSTSADQGAYNLPCRRTGGEFLSRSDMPVSLSTHHPLGFFRSVRDNRERGFQNLGYGTPAITAASISPAPSFKGDRYRALARLFSTTGNKSQVTVLLQADSQGE